MNEPFKLFVTNYRERHIRGVQSYQEIETEDLTNIDGLMVQFTGCQPPQAVFYSTPYAGANGASYNSGRLNTRNIVLSFSLLSNQEANRLRIYSLFRTGSKVRLEFITHRRAWIDGFVESITENRSSAQRKQVIQVSIICYDPLFKALDWNKITVQGTSAGVTFPLNYGGDVPYGIKAKITFSGTYVEEPFLKNNTDNVGNWGGIRIIEPDGEHPSTFAAGDTMNICTIDGQKEVYKLDTNNVRTNLLNRLQQPIGWFKIIPGSNSFTFDATVGGEKMSLELETLEVYEGI